MTTLPDSKTESNPQNIYGACQPLGDDLRPLESEATLDEVEVDTPPPEKHVQPDSNTDGDTDTDKVALSSGTTEHTKLVMIHPDIVPRCEYGVTGGDPGSGKTTLLLKIIADAAKQGNRLLYLYGDQAPSTMQKKVREAGIGDNYRAQDFRHGVTSVDTIFNICDEAIKQMGRLDIILIDPLLDLMFNIADSVMPLTSRGEIAEFSENKPRPMIAMINGFLMPLATKYNCAVECIAHQSKGGDTRDSVPHSYQLGAKAHATRLMYSHDGNLSHINKKLAAELEQYDRHDTKLYRIKKDRGNPTQYNRFINVAAPGLTWMQPAGVKPAQTSRDKIVALLRSCSASTRSTKTSICRSISGHRPDIFKELNAMIDGKLVTEKPDGYYLADDKFTDTDFHPTTLQ